MSYISEKLALSGSKPSDYVWKDGKCLDTTTGRYYQGSQQDSNCYAQYGPAPASSGWGAVTEWGLSLIKPPATQQPVYQQGSPTSAFTASGMLLPAVVVVGGVALILLLRKK
jgi:hypothetical protein